MSEQANEQLVRAGYDAFNKGDMDTALAFIDPDIEVSYRGAAIDAHGNYRGVAGVVELQQRILESFEVESFEIEIEQLVARGDRVVVGLHQTAVGRSSGVPVDIRTGQVWTLRDGRAVRWEVYPDAETALEALDLPA